MMKRTGAALLVGMILVVVAASLTAGGRPTRFVSVFEHPLDRSEEFEVAARGAAEDDQVWIISPDRALALGISAPDSGGRRLIRHQPRDVQVNFRRPSLRRCYLADTDGDGTEELFVCSREAKALGAADSVVSYWVDCYGLGSVPRYSLGPFLSGCRASGSGRAGMIQFHGAADADRDGRPEIYLFEYPFRRGCVHRALRAYDGPTGRELWHLEIATPGGVFVFPRAARGHEADCGIVLSSHACSNGFIEGDTADSLSYLTGVRPDGRRAWQLTMGGRGTSTDVVALDRDGDGDQEIVGALQDGSPGPDGSVPALALDAGTGIAEKVRLPAFPDKMRASDVDSDGREEILLVDTQGGLHCLGPDLTQRWRAGASFREVESVVDLDGDGQAEVVCAATDSVVVLSGSTGRLEIAALSGGQADKVRVRTARLSGRPHLLVRQGEFLRFLRLEPLPWIAAHGRTLAGGAVSLGLAAVLMRGRTGRRRPSDAGNLGAAYELLSYVRGLRHGREGAAWRVVERLRSYLKSWDRLPAAGGVAHSPVPALVEELRRLVIPQLRETVRHADRAGVPRSVWDSLVQDAQAASEDLTRLLDPGREEEMPRVRRARSRLDAIDTSLEALRGWLHRYFRADFAEAVGRVLERRRGEIGRWGVQAAVRDAQTGRALGFAAPTVLEQAIDACVDNALRALVGRPQRKLEITVVGGEGVCQVEIADTGPGLDVPPESWPRVFERSYSTRDRRPGEEPGGFGLYNAREQLALFGGEIAVVDSSPAGTTFRITLVKAESFDDGRK